MQPVLTAAAMAACDQYTITEIGIPSLVLMERASCVLAQTIEDHFQKSGSDKASYLICAVCGSGNNGGDGVACARILFMHGFNVKIVLVGNPDHFSEEMKTQIEIARKLGIPFTDDRDLNKASVIIDAIFGIGLSREIKSDSKAADAIRKINETSSFVVSADIPSGIDADSGQIRGLAVKADVTVTMEFLKRGLVLYPGAEYSGKIICAEIGIVSSDGHQDALWTLEDTDLKFIPKRPRTGNKGTFGKVLIVAGSKNMCGAALLSARSCFKMGAGMVRLLTPEENRIIVQESLPEVMLNTYSNEEEAIRELKKASDWADVIACGPGIGQSDISKAVVNFILNHLNKPLVLDADGLNVLNGQTEKLSAYAFEVLITPHPGEMSRLTGKSVQEILKDLVGTARDFAISNHVTCLLKGAATVIASVDGTVYVNRTGNSGMATAGSGDVLTGMAAALMALHCPTDKAGVLASYIHGKAGDEAARELCEASVIASDIIEAIPKIL